MSIWAITTCSSCNIQTYEYPDPLGLRVIPRDPDEDGRRARTAASFAAASRQPLPRRFQVPRVELHEPAWITESGNTHELAAAAAPGAFPGA